MKLTKENRKLIKTADSINIRNKNGVITLEICRKDIIMPITFELDNFLPKTAQDFFIYNACYDFAGIQHLILCASRCGDVLTLTNYYKQAYRDHMKISYVELRVSDKNGNYKCSIPIHFR